MKNYIGEKEREELRDRKGQVCEIKSGEGERGTEREREMQRGIQRERERERERETRNMCISFEIPQTVIISSFHNYIN